MGGRCCGWGAVGWGGGVGWVGGWVGLRFFETSASSGENVQAAFTALFGAVVRNLPQR